MGEDEFIQSSESGQPEANGPAERRERTDRRIADRRTQARRYEEASPGNAPRRSWLVPATLLAALLGLAAGFALSRLGSAGSMRIKESPFGLEAHKSSRGRDFAAGKEMRRW